MTRVLLAGASGTIGRAVAQRLAAAGHDVIAPGRTACAPNKHIPCFDDAGLAIIEAPVDVVISCVASRTGAPRDAWNVDYGAQAALLRAAERLGAQHFISLSAICVQKPRLAFQHAKLKFEAELRKSPIAHTIIHATAYFKSLSGQIARVQAGKPYLLFGDGCLTACKPISDSDLAQVIVDNLDTPAGTIVVGGPGPAITPRDQVMMLGQLTGRDIECRHVPVAMMRMIAGGLGLIPGLSAKAELARIGLYYATESMLVWNATAQRYDADATPEYGTDTLRDHYAALLTGSQKTDLGAHKMF